MFGCVIVLAFILSIIFIFGGSSDTKGPAVIVLIITIILMKLYSKSKPDEKKIVASPAPKTPQPVPQPVNTHSISTKYDITEDDILNENVIFEDDAIYYKRKKWDGVKWTIERQKVYVYKRSYHLDMGGGPPRFHICRCSTINSFLKQGRLREDYRKSDEDIVWVRNVDFQNEETKISHLPLCLNCYKKMKKQYSWLDSKTDNQDFVRRVIKKTNWA